MSQTAALAIPNLETHVPPSFEIDSSIPVPYSYGEYKISSKLSRRSKCTNTQLVSFAILVVVLVVQFLWPSSSLYQSSFPTIPDLKPDFIARSSVGVCINKDPFSEDLPYTRVQKMSLVDEARQVAAEFEYPAEAVNEAVKEFMKEMGAFNMCDTLDKTLY